MSNQPNFAYKRAPRDKAEEKTFTIDDDTFRLRPKLGSIALDAFARAVSGDVVAVCDSLRAMLVDDGEYARFMGLDLDDDELQEVVQGLIGVYGDAGKSSGSPTASNGDGTSSKRTSPASTPASTSAT